MKTCSPQPRIRLQLPISILSIAVDSTNSYPIYVSTKLTFFIVENLLSTYGQGSGVVLYLFGTSINYLLIRWCVWMMCTQAPTYLSNMISILKKS